MMYEIDVFGFTYGFLKGNYTLMSELDIAQDKRMQQELSKIKFERWKYDNVTALIKDYKSQREDSESFDRFCRKEYEKSK